MMVGKCRYDAENLRLDRRKNAAYIAAVGAYAFFKKGPFRKKYGQR
ncbi:hypothetical protein ACQYAD_17470 [Neobacillus sp. SM06]